MTESSDIEELRARVTRLEAERGVLEVLHRYGPALDHGDEEAWVDCFADDAVFEVGGPGARAQRRLQGRDELRAFASSHTRAPDAWHRHCVLDALITVDGDRATSIAYFVRVDGLADGPAVQSFGRYHDQLARGTDGRWRFIHRVAECDAARQSPFGSHRRDERGGVRPSVGERRSAIGGGVIGGRPASHETGQDP